MNSPYPPDYIKLPPTIACADVEDGVIVTMARILGLCWTSRYRETSPLPPDRLAELVGRSRATLYRHLNRAQELAGSRWSAGDVGLSSGPWCPLPVSAPSRPQRPTSRPMTFRAGMVGGTSRTMRENSDRRSERPASSAAPSMS